MSRISVEPFRFSDYRALKTNVYFDYEGEYDSISLAFRCKDNVLEIISTSVGQIRDEQVLMKPVHEAQLYVDHCDSDSIQCLIGYYEDTLLRFSDILVADLYSSRQIGHTSPQIREVPTKRTSFDKRLQDFTKSLETLRSDWKINLNCADDDMILTIDKNGTDSIVASLGEVTEDVRASDYLFSIDPEISLLHIPKEIVTRAKKAIGDNSKRIAIFELITPDFVNLQRFYKIPISNTVVLSEIK